MTCSLEGAFIPDKYVARIVPAGGLDAYVLGLFAWGGLGFANIYCGWQSARSTSLFRRCGRRPRSR